MKKITIGQLKDLSNEDNYDITRVLIEPVISSFLFQKDDFEIAPTDKFIAELVDRCSIGQKKLLTQWGIIEPEPELIKLEIGSYIYCPEGKVRKVTKKMYGDSSGYEAICKDGTKTYIEHASDFHKQLKIATPEQIESFNCPWNEGIEEAKKYKDGQPCLVRDCIGDDWILRFSTGNGDFYNTTDEMNQDISDFKYHLPLNEQTIKNLPVNE